MIESEGRKMTGMNKNDHEHKGFMLDVCRHFMPLDEIKKLLQAAAVLKLNRMHWHLTDDQGWRIEIRKYPLLTEKGAVRGDSFFGGTPEAERNSGYYTQEEIRNLVAYAKDLGIEIIPEIEIPGHAAAMLAAYPQFGCRRGKTGVWEEKVEISGGIFPALVCAGKEETLGFLKDILDEVTELFPFPAVHIGGDEALKFRWRRCPDCQKRIREKGLQSEDDLQRDLLMEVGEYLAGKGRKTIVWNDVLAGGPLPAHFIVQQWMGGRQETLAFMQSGGTVIRSDTDSFYLDYCYGRIDVRRIHETPRIPEYAVGLENRILGVECPLWTERIASLERAAWQLFPRLTAVSVKMSGEDLQWEDFREKVKTLEAELETKTGLKGAPEELWDMDPETAEADRKAETQTIFSGKAEAYEQMERKIVSLDAAERLAESLGIDRSFVQRGGDIIWTEIHGQEVPEDDDGAAILIRQLMIAADSRKYGAWKDIPEEIWMETMKCFPRFISEHRRSYGRDGFDRYGWTTRQIGAKLFRIGELEYELAEDEEGRKEIGLHIPSDAKLEAERMNASLKAADAFIRERFPGWAGVPKTCESWLLSPTLKDLLPEGSRILKFQEAFELKETYPEDDAALEWVFYVAERQREGLDISRLPEDTSLQRKMKAMLMEGRKPGAAKGVLVNSEFIIHDS